MIRLKELREERGWKSMAEAARNLGKQYMTYVHHEKGDREPDSDDLKAYAKAFGVSIDYLVGRTNEKTPIAISDEGNNDLLLDLSQLNEEQRKLIQDVLRLNDQQRSAVLSVTESFLSGQ